MYALNCFGTINWTVLRLAASACAQAYTNAKLQRFAYAFAQRLNPNLSKEQIDYVANEALHAISAMAEPAPAVPQQNLRLVLRHDCL